MAIVKALEPRFRCLLCVLGLATYLLWMHHLAGEAGMMYTVQVTWDGVWTMPAVSEGSKATM